MNLFSENRNPSRSLRRESSADSSPVESTLHDELLLTMIEGVGPKIRGNLLAVFGDPATILAAPHRELLAVDDVGPKLATRIVRARETLDPEPLIDRCRREGIDILTQNDPRYPQSLREICDPPAVLFLRGTLVPEDRFAVAMVGTRGMTAYGERQAERLAGELTQAGFTVVSGLARGIDGAAHRGALAKGGRTIAVLGSGLMCVTPPEHRSLSREVIENGALLSEYPPDMAPRAGTFPQRNRIVSGLSLGTIIVEAPAKSGALITARLASEQGREVFAVPGPVDHSASVGCHRLLRDGATLVASVEDVLESLGPLSSPAKHPHRKEPVRQVAELKLNEKEQNVLRQIATVETPVDQVIAECGLPPSQVLATLSVLEIRRLIRRTRNNAVVRL
jgi:DNA processing protein